MYGVERQFWPVVVGKRERLIERRDVVRSRFGQFIRRLDGRRRQIRVHVLGDGRFELLLVLLISGLRNDEVLLVRRQLRLRSHHFDRRKRPDFNLPFVVIQKLLGIRHCVLGHTNTFAVVKQPVIEVDHVRDGSHHLLPERGIGLLHIVLGDAEKLGVGAIPEAVQQVLGKADRHLRRDLGIEQVES